MWERKKERMEYRPHRVARVSVGEKERKNGMQTAPCGQSECGRERKKEREKERKKERERERERERTISTI